METKNIIIAVALGGVALLGVLFPKATNTVVENVIEKPLGALSSPDIMSPYFSVGGVRFWAAATDSMSSATTTVCALQSPAATSSLVTGSVEFTVSSSTASTVTLARSTTAFATTTSLGTLSLSAGAQGYAIASTTGNHIFAPNTWFVVGMQGGSAGASATFSPTGTCRALWMEI